MTLINGEFSIKLPESRDAFHVSHPEWERYRNESMYKNIQPGDVLIDVGTEIGDYAALYTLWGAKVVCIEPQPKYWPMIKEIFELNKIRPLLNFAGFANTVTDLNPLLADFDLGYTKGWPNSAYDEVDWAWGGFRNAIETGVCTPQTRLDDLVIHKVNVINIDVEGAELEVLKGAERILKKNKPLVYVSVHPEMLQHDYGVQPTDVVEYMKRFGYEYEVLAIDHEHHYVFFQEGQLK